MHIRLPEDLSIVGYDDTELMSELPKPITTVRVASDRVGKMAADLIVDMLEGRTSVSGARIPSEIVVRSTTGPAPKD